MTVDATFAAGKGSRAILAQPADCKPAPTKTTVVERDGKIGPDDVKTTTTEPVAAQESVGGELPKQAWWLTAFCFVSPTC